MGKYNDRIVFIDGFAGPGAYAGGEDGSPIVALKTAAQHTNPLWRELVMVFIEGDPARYEHLKGKLDEYPTPASVKVHHTQGSFDEHLASVLKSMEHERSRLAPTFAFIDPFGFSHTPMSVIKRIMRNEKCEVFINFMYEEVNRFIEHPNPKIGEHFDGLFGSTEWRTSLKLGSPEERKGSIMDLYVRQLQRAGGIRYVWTFEMAGKDNRTDYFLVFGTNNLAGLKKMKEAMWTVDAAGGNFFSDAAAKDPQQQLFAAGPDFDLVRRLITERFRRETCTVEDVEQFVLEETPFRETHFKTQVLAPMEKEGLLRVMSSPRKRAFSYPEGTQLQFADVASLFD
jgi:three-Cys-motif partner protein